MSSLPGFRLENFIAWHYDFVVEGLHECNQSLGIAEILGVPTRRKCVTETQFALLVKDFEAYRETVEDWLIDFDEENQSWRGYAANCPIPDAVLDEALSTVRLMRGEQTTE